MKLIPVVMHHPSQAPATAEQLEAAYRLCANAVSVYQRMIGRSAWVQIKALSVENTGNAAPSMTRANEDRVAWDDRSLFNGVANSLDAAGHDLGADVYATWLLGNPLDGSGRGGSWTMGWMTDGQRGGLAVMGEMRLQTAIANQIERDGYYRLSDPPRQFDPGTQARYAIWLATHEVGHALGLPHTEGTPLDPVLMEQSVMAYGRHDWVLGANAHRVGLLDHEIDWLRGHALFADSSEGHMKQMDPEEAKRVLDGEVPLRIGLGPGVTVEELMPRLGG